MNVVTAETSQESVAVRASIALSATFTADPLVDLLNLFMRETRLDLEVVLAPYGQVFQELLDRTRLFSRNHDGVNVVLVRFEDWIRQADSEPDLPSNRGKL